MPLYEYECTKCGHRTELLQRYGDPPLEKCPECGAAVRKLFSAPAVQFKGTGWYVTDYGGKSKPPATGAGSEGGDKKAAKTEASDKPKKTGEAKGSRGTSSGSSGSGGSGSGGSGSEGSGSGGSGSGSKSSGSKD